LGTPPAKEVTHALRDSPAFREDRKQKLKAAIQEAPARVLIRRYLDWVEQTKTKGPGRKRTVESVDKRLVQIDEAFPTADNLTRLTLVQERINLLISEQIQANVEAGVLEDRFVRSPPTNPSARTSRTRPGAKWASSPRYLSVPGSSVPWNPAARLSANGDSGFPVAVAFG
jgi:hypothetical protein